MRYQFLRFPGGRAKAVTFSYDDALRTDLKLSKLMKDRDMKCTFNINSSLLSHEDAGWNISVREMTEILMADGHEIAIHGAQHIAPGAARTLTGLRDALDCRLELEKMTGTIIRGMAYPDSGITVYNNAATYEKVCQYLTELGIVYARSLAGDNDQFLLPGQWHNWIPTAHHDNPCILQWAKKFVELDIDSLYVPDRWPRLFYIWGHTYEFDNHNNWDHLDQICDILGGRDEIWYATNIEICDYVHAFEALRFSADNTLVHNPTATKLWLDVDGAVYEIAPGQTIHTERVFHLRRN